MHLDRKAARVLAVIVLNGELWVGGDSRSLEVTLVGVTMDQHGHQQ